MDSGHAYIGPGMKAAGDGSDLPALSARAQAERVRRGEVSARMLLEAHLAHFDAHNDRLNAVIRTDIPAARAQADRLDAMAARGDHAGLLHGIPMTVKDTFDVRNMPASAGCADYGAREEDVADAILIARLRQAGAVIWGKTNTSYLALGYHTANALHGQTCNPCDASRSAGGSSGGSAAAVAARLTPLELGSDIGGSLRVPAHFCGVCALKPSFGLLTLRGHIPPAPGSFLVRDLDVAGPMARSVGDVRLALRVLAPDMAEGRAVTSFDGMRIALWMDEENFPIHDAGARALALCSEVARAGGAHAARAKPRIDAQHILSVYSRLLMPVLSVDLAPAAWRLLHFLRPVAALIARFRRHGLTEAIVNATISHRGWLQADAERKQLLLLARDFFSAWDVILTPVAPVSAFVHPRRDRPVLRSLEAISHGAGRFSFWSIPASILHLPAIVLPVGHGPDGLPVGIQIIGKPGGEQALLDISEMLETSLGDWSSRDLSG